MTTDYTQADSELTLSFPEALSIPDFKLDEVISGMTPSQTHYLTLTIRNEQPNSQLNQALQKAISGKNHVQITVTRSDGRTCNENVVVKESEPKQPNVCSGLIIPDTWLGRSSAFAGGIPSLC